MPPSLHYHRLPLFLLIPHRRNDDDKSIFTNLPLTTKQNNSNVFLFIYLFIIRTNSLQ